MKRTFTPKTMILAIAVALVSLVGGSLAVAAVSGGVEHTAPQTPVSALQDLPAQSTLPTDVAQFIARAAVPTESKVENLEARVRLVRTNLGTQKSDVYAFSDDHGRPCIYVTKLLGSCATVANTNTPGFYWSIGGGYPNSPSSLIGIATDDIAKVVLTIDGDKVDVPLVNNLAFVEYPSGARHASVTVTYGDGSEKTASLNLG